MTTSTRKPKSAGRNDLNLTEDMSSLQMTAVTRRTDSRGHQGLTAWHPLTSGCSNVDFYKRRDSGKVPFHIYYLIGESYIWCIRRQLAQRAFPTIATFVPPISSTKWQGSYVELFLNNALPFVKVEIEVKGEGCWLWFVKEIAFAAVWRTNRHAWKKW